MATPKAIRKTTIESFRKQLFARREAIAADLRAATAEFVNADVAYTDEIDQASADTEKSLALQIKNRERELLLQIDAGLKRIEAGTFGECERCGENISEARLKASLFTTVCIDCKSEIESEDRRMVRLA